jgi:hypothetical protein
VYGIIGIRNQDGTVPHDIEQWWRANGTGALTYSALVGAFAPHVAQRQALLASIIEPSPSDSAEKLKTPTAGHRALAELVAAGYVRVVITTNFDRLIERAASEAGVEAQVLTGEADLRAMLPIQHTKCTIVKLHGDYQKANLLNVEDELDQYPENLARLLNRVLDEYGLFAIGWSGETDTALCRAIRATSQNPFGRYFGVRHEPSSQIQDFVATQKGVAMPISTGDEFFDRLVATIKEVENRPQRPLKLAALVGTTKRLLSQGRTRIELRELLLREARLLKETLDGLEAVQGPYKVDLAATAERSQPIAGAIATGCFYGETSQHDLWTDAFRVVADQPDPRSGYAWRQRGGLRRLPACIAMYAGVLAAWAAEDVKMIDQLLNCELRSTVFRGEERCQGSTPAYIALNPAEVIDSNDLGLGEGKWPNMVSNEVIVAIRPVLADVFPASTDFGFAYEDVEYLLALLQEDWYSTTGYTRWEGRTFHAGVINMPGAFVGAQPTPAPERFERRQGRLSATALVEFGMFGRDPERLAKAQERVLAGLPAVPGSIR